MHFDWEWLHPVIQVPYVPTIGPVHPNALAPSLFDDVIRVAGTGAFLAYDKDQRWADTKDETVLPEHIEHTSTCTLIPTMSHRRGSTLTVYAYGPADEEAAALASKLTTDHRVATARIVTFHRSQNTLPTGTAVTRVQLREFGPNQPQDETGAVRDVDTLPDPVRATFAAFADRLTSNGFAFLHSHMQAQNVGPVLATTHGARVVGAIGPMQTMPDSAGATRLLPQYFGVLPEHRGHGHGRALWRAAMAWGAAHNADYQLLQTEIGGASDRLCQTEGLHSLGYISVAQL